MYPEDPAPSSLPPSDAPFRPQPGATVRWEPPTPAELQALISGYSVEMLLGKGGMGAVFKGIQLNLDRPVAIKIISNELDEEYASYGERFKNEARAMAKLSHPGIVGVYDYGKTSNGMLYIVMEYIEGTDVSSMISQQQRLHTQHAMAITAHVCDALAYAHERGIIHRDIKPANIMVGYDGVVKVADFGLAKMTQSGESGLTLSGMAMGTPHYMAPETLTLGSAVDHRADIYAVGVMLYQMLTGKLPRGLFEMPSLLVSGLDPRYDGIISKALREARDVRYQSAAEMRQDLDSILTQPVVKVDPDAKQAPAALATMARPKRPEGKVRRPGQNQPAMRHKKNVSPLFWVTTALLIGLAAWLYFIVSEKSREIQMGENVPNVKIESQATGITTVNSPANNTPLNNKAAQVPQSDAPAPDAAPAVNTSQQGLVSWWKADGDARDSVGSNQGVLVGTASYADGLFGKAFLLDGGHVEFPDSPTLQMSSESKFTVTLWAYRISPYLPFHLFGKRLPNPPTSTAMIGFQLGVDSSMPPTPINEWVFWTLVCDGVKQSVYINGKWAVNTKQIGAINTATFRIGRSANYAAFKGKIDDFRIYDRAMTDTEIKTLFDAAAALNPPPETNITPSIEWDDALALVDPAKHASAKSVWSRTPEGIAWKSNDQSPRYAGSFQLPASLSPSYVIDVEFTCGALRESVAILIPVGDGRVPHCAFSGKGFVGIDKVDGKDSDQVGEPGVASPFHMEQGKRYSARAEVRRAPEGVDIQFIVDGKSVGKYRGPIERLTRSTFWPNDGDTTHARLGSNGSVVFHTARIKPLVDIRIDDLKIALEQPAKADEDGQFVSGFNGRDLTNWEGDSRFWSIRNGCIVGERSPKNNSPHSEFLKWKDGAFEDFELRLSFRLGNGGSSHVTFRGAQAPNNRLLGYSYHLASGQLIDDAQVLMIRKATTGLKSIWNPDGVKSSGSVAAMPKLALDGWRKLVIVARGNHLVHQIDGLTVLEVTDDDPNHRRLDGFLALVIDGGGEVEFKDIEIKRLANGKTLVAADPMKADPSVVSKEKIILPPESPAIISASAIETSPDLPYAGMIKSIKWAGTNFQARYMGTVPVSEKKLGVLQKAVRGLAFHPDGRIAVLYGTGAGSDTGLDFWDMSDTLSPVVKIISRPAAQDSIKRTEDETHGIFGAFDERLAFDRAGNCFFAQLGIIRKVMSAAPVLIEKWRPAEAPVDSLQIPHFDDTHFYVTTLNQIHQITQEKAATPGVVADPWFSLSSYNIRVRGTLVLSPSQIIVWLSQSPLLTSKSGYVDKALLFDREAKTCWSMPTDRFGPMAMSWDGKRLIRFDWATHTIFEFSLPMAPAPNAVEKPSTPGPPR